jgi:hypothetical protein
VAVFVNDLCFLHTYADTTLRWPQPRGVVGLYVVVVHKDSGAWMSLGPIGYPAFGE